MAERPKERERQREREGELEEREIRVELTQYNTHTHNTIMRSFFKEKKIILPDRSEQRMETEQIASMSIVALETSLALDWVGSKPSCGSSYGSNSRPDEMKRCCLETNETYRFCR